MSFRQQDHHEQDMIQTTHIVYSSDLDAAVYIGTKKTNKRTQIKILITTAEDNFFFVVPVEKFVSIHGRKDCRLKPEPHS